jgi:glycerol-3-phosphate O-acyltransferase / dihydroxyacetone phosphate acyltransferase
MDRLTAWIPSFIELFTNPAETKEISNVASDVKKKLVDYYGLLHYSGISHGDLAQVYPSSDLPSSFTALLTLVQQFIALVAHPRFWLFVPPCIMHIPAYIVGPFAARKLMKRGEEESVAELTVVPAGITFGLTSYVASFKLASMIFTGQIASLWPGMPNVLKNVGGWYVKNVPSVYGLRRAVGTVAIMYWTTWVVFKWHSLLVKGKWYHV